MIGFLKRLWNDRRGNALMIAGAALPIVVGAAGLATDTVQWAMWKRDIQRAADSAAFAGVYAQVQSGSGMTAEQAVDIDLSNHTTTGFNLVTNRTIAYPTGSGYTNAVRVTLSVQRRLGFSSLFLSQAPTITASATAALFDSGSYCVVALSKTGSALTIGGSANVNMGCGAISNSTDSTDSVGVNGNAHTFVATPVAGVGAISDTINGSPDVRSYQLEMADPYSGLSTSVPSGVPCTNFNSHIVGNGNGNNNGTVTLNPGCFTNFNPGNNTYQLNPGVYYLNNTNLSLSGQTRLVGTGVTIVLTGTNPGSLTMSGNSSLALSAPTATNCGTYSGTNSCNFQNMLIVQSPNATSGNNNTINGDNNSSYDGAIYFPKGDVQLNGSSAAATRCAMVVALTVEFTGNTNLQNTTTGCTAATQVSGRRVRLIA
ncbi:MAG: pilus assembly protein TadG-related protein [Alphaproteobacteria bacterium]